MVQLLLNVLCVSSWFVSAESGNKGESCNTPCFSGSSRQLADDTNEGGVLVLQPLVVCFEVPQHLIKH